MVLLEVGSSNRRESEEEIVDQDIQPSFDIAGYNEINWIQYRNLSHSSSDKFIP